MGIDQSYISRWRKGERPIRLHESTRRKLAAAVGSEVPRDDGTALAFAAGVLWGIERDARHIAETARAAREKLGYDAGISEDPPIPFGSEIADGLAGLRTLESGQAASPKGRRKGPS